MELVQDQVERKHQQLKNELTYCLEVLRKSEKYERLVENDDFLEVLNDMREVIKFHKKEIDGAMSALSQMKSKDRAEAYDVLFVHQMRLEQVEEAVARPQEILEAAKKARERIPEIKEEIQRLQENLTNV